MNIFKSKLVRVFIFLIVAGLTVMLMSVNLSCISDSERAAVDGSETFVSGRWDRARGEIFDRDGEPLVYNTPGKDEGIFIRHYDKCPEEYSAIIGYYAALKNEKEETVERIEGLENTMSEWLLLGDDVKNVIGGSIVLTTDSSLQKVCFDQIKDMDRAAAVIIDIETGEILAITDAPGYNTQALTRAGTVEKYDSLLKQDMLFPFATRTQIPGSVFKLVIASVFCDADALDMIVDDDGLFEYDGGHKIRNAENKAYGKIDLPTAIRRSSNIYFVEVAKSIGADAMKGSLVEKWKMDRSIELDFVTLHQNFCLDNRHLLYTTAFGQGDVQISPLQMCMMTAAIGDSKGDYFKPYLFKELINADGKKVRSENSSRKTITRKAVSADAREIILNGMVACAADKKLNDINGRSAAIKTGTAQIGDDRVNIWMTGLYPSDDPKYAVTVASFDMPKNGNWGGDLAPKMRRILEALSDYQ